MTGSEFSAAWARTRRGCAHHTTDGIGCYTLPALSGVPGVSHGFSDRTGGVSTGCFSSMNLSLTRKDDPGKVLENYRLFARAMGFSYDSMVSDHYAHGTVVRRVDAGDRGKGFTKPLLPSCDGLVTDDPEVTLITGHADCMAFFCVDPVHRAVGLAHAGWRGALGRIGKVLIETMEQEFHSDPETLLLGVGPSICQDCFEVDPDVGDLFREAFPNPPCIRPGKPGKEHVDLWMAAFCQFIEAGALPEHINLSDVCTVETDALYSHRRDKGRTGGMAAFLRLTEG